MPPTTTVTPTTASRWSRNNGQFLQKLKDEKDALTLLETEHTRLQGIATGLAAPATTARGNLDPTSTTSTISIRSEAKLSTDKLTATNKLRSALNAATNHADLTTALNAFTSAYGSNIPLDVSAAITALKDATFDAANKSDIATKLTTASGDLATAIAKPKGFFGAAREFAHTQLSRMPKVSTTPATNRRQKFTRWVQGGINKLADYTETTRLVEIRKAALRESLLAICSETAPLREEMDAKKAVTDYETSHINPKKGDVEKASVKAFMEVNGIYGDANMDSAIDIYNGLHELRDMWAIKPDIDKLDPTIARDYGVKGVFNGQFKIRPKSLRHKQALVFSDTTGSKKVTANDSQVIIRGDMKPEELMAILMNTCDQWKTNGLKIKADSMDEARKFDAALKKLATLPGYDHCSNYIIHVNRIPMTSWVRMWGLTSTFHGAKHNIADGKRRDLTRSRRWRNAARHADAMTDADAVLPAVRTLAAERLTRRAAAAAATGGTPTVSRP